jgi:hypothetical protein
LFHWSIFKSKFLRNVSALYGRLIVLCLEIKFGSINMCLSVKGKLKAVGLKNKMTTSHKL